MLTIIVLCSFSASDPTVAKEVHLFVCKYITEISFDFLHRRVIRCHPSPDQAKGVRIPIIDINSTFVDIFEQIFSHVEASWPTAHYSESELLL